MKMTILILMMAVFTISCEKEEEINDTIDENIASELPLLNGENRIGLMQGYNPSNPEATIDSMDARWQEAIQAGMTIGRLQIDWPELEPSTNVFDKNVLEEQLKEMKDSGLQPFLLISAYDSEGPVFPDDLEGKSIDNSEVIQRFNNLMDWVIPMVVDNNGYLISIVNESDNSFGEDHPLLHSQIKSFLVEVRDHIHGIDNRMAVTVTIAEGNIKNHRTKIQEIVKECDIACWNFYGSTSVLTPPYTAVLTNAEIKENLQAIIDISGEKHVVIQELGMHSGGGILQSSEEIQRNFYQVFFSEMQKTDQIKVANVWQLVDWSPELTEFYMQAFDDEEIDPIFIQALSASLNSIGLIQYEDGTRKDAWDEMIKWMEEFR